MNSNTENDFRELLERYPALSVCREETEQAFALLLECAKENRTIFVCGNGGSAADSEHIVGELMKCFKRPRPIDPQFRAALTACGPEGEKLADTLEGGIRAVSLTSHLALSTAYSNDRSPQAVFAQQLSVLGQVGDCLITISTSGNSENCVYAGIVAKAKGMKVIAMTGSRESRLSALANVSIRVPAEETFKIQEYHLPIYHALCAMLESELFS